MNRHGNPKALREANANKTLEARDKALKAIEEFKKKKLTITYSGISKHSGVSRKFLHNDEIVSVVMKKYTEPNAKVIRTQDSKDAAIFSLKREISQLKKKITEQQKDESYRQKYEELLDENRKLREQLRRSYKF